VQRESLIADLTVSVVVVVLNCGGVRSFYIIPFSADCFYVLTHSVHQCVVIVYNTAVLFQFFSAFVVSS